MAPLGKLVRAIGLMSGTSMDGIDVAFIKTDGENEVVRGPNAAFPYPEEFRGLLRQAVADARAMRDRSERPGVLADVERELTDRHAEAVRAFMEANGLSTSDVDVVGFHGQTVLHRPPEPHGRAARFGDAMTVQIGDGARLAKLTGLEVVYDLRAADVAAGGQGAPLVPVYQRALAARFPQRPVAFLNVGGVANVTWIGEDGRLIAFDTGPGNAMMDDWTLQKTGSPYDKDGTLARGGACDAEILRRYLLNPYFERGIPKSLDRHDFALDDVSGLSAADGAATLAAFTAAAVARSIQWFPAPPALWVVSGGGRRNKFLMELVAGHLDACVAPAEAVSLDGDALEAEAWAYLAVRSLKGLPITFPGTTGVAHPMTGGVAVRSPAA